MYIPVPEVRQPATIRFPDHAALRDYWQTVDRNLAFPLRLIGRIELDTPLTASQLRRLPAQLRELLAA